MLFCKNILDEIAMRYNFHQPEMIMWLLASLIFDSIWQLKKQL